MKLTEDLFKKLATPLCQNKNNNKKPKKYNQSYYKSFNRYLDLHNFETILDQNNFEKYFLDFCRIEFGDDENSRLDFKDKTKIDLLKSSGGCCAICGTLTIFPLKGSNNESLTIGAACHIRPASAYGPRADVTYRDCNLDEISSMDNGIWACLNCHKEIDKNHNLYTVSYLKELKIAHELIILKLKESKVDIKKLINSFEMSNNFDYIYINRKIHENSQIQQLDLTKQLIDTFNRLKEIEKESLENASVFKLIKYLNIKKDEEFKDLNVKMSQDKISLYGELKDTDKSIEELKSYYHEEIGKYLQYDYTMLEIKEYNRKNELVKKFSDYNKELEIFIINKSEKKIIRLDEHNFTGFECFNGEVRIGAEKNHEFLYIDLIKTQIGTKVKIISNDLKHFFNFITPIIKIKDFKIDETFIMVRYNEKIFTIDLGILIKFKNNPN